MNPLKWLKPGGSRAVGKTIDRGRAKERRPMKPVIREIILKSRVHHFVLVELEDKLQNLGELLHEGLVESTLSNFSFVRYLSSDKRNKNACPWQGISV
jgi:hypothetical protein